MRSFFRLTNIRRQRSLKKMSTSYNTKSSPRVYIQVLGAETKDTSPSLFVFADSQRYLFNCGEGTQRILSERKLKMTKINNIFFTRICWEYVGGVSGFAMTLRDNGKSQIKLCGPSNLPDFINATRFFLYHESLDFDCVGFTGNNEEKFEDDNLIIWPVVINESGQDTKRHTQEPQPSSPHDHDAPQASLYHSNGEDDQPSLKKLKPCRKSSTAVCYICQLTPLPGKFFPKRAVELGVPKGRLFGELHSGNTVTLPDGRQIKPEQVMEPCQPGQVFMIVDCPSEDFLQSLVCNEHLRRHYKGGPCETPVVIVHLTPMSIFMSEPYKRWRNRFGDKVSHLLINKDVCATPLVFQSQATLQCKLHSVDPEIFPLLETSDIPVVKQSDLPNNCFAGENFLQFHLRPIKEQGFDRCAIPDKLDTNSIIHEARSLLNGNLNVTGVAGFDERNYNREELRQLGSIRPLSTSSTIGTKDLIRNPPVLQTQKIPVRKVLEAVGATSMGEGESGVSLAELVKMKAHQIVVNRENYEVVFLGTGAACPSKYRNVSATLINMSDTSSMLLDCGEGTYGQLYRHYGELYGNRVLLRLKCVFISHIHADHHLGLIRIIQQRDALHPGEPLLVIGPDKIGEWLYEYDTVCEDISYRFVDSSDLVQHREGDYWDVHGHLEAKEVLTVPVDHCCEAYGLVLKHQHGWKIVYSGDTRPCPELIEAGKDADLLIHEATLEDELQTEALARKHSTTTEAIESGVKMGAKFVMLNHFSQRYPKIPVFSGQFTKYTGIAFDHMRIHSSNFSKIPQLLEPLKTVFAEEIDEMNKTK